MGRYGEIWGDMGVQVAMTLPRHFRDTSMGVQVVMTAVAVLLMDRAGRRALLLVSLAGMCFCAAAMGAFHLNAQQPTWLVPHLQSIESSVGSVGGVGGAQRPTWPAPAPPLSSGASPRRVQTRPRIPPPLIWKARPRLPRWLHRHLLARPRRRPLAAGGQAAGARDRADSGEAVH